MINSQLVSSIQFIVCRSTFTPAFFLHLAFAFARRRLLPSLSRLPHEHFASQVYFFSTEQGCFLHKPGKHLLHNRPGRILKLVIRVSFDKLLRDC